MESSLRLPVNHLTLPPPQEVSTIEDADSIKKRRLISELPDSLDEIGGSAGLERYTLCALKKLARKHGCVIPANASRAATCGVLENMLTRYNEKDSDGTVGSGDIHEVFLTG